MCLEGRQDASVDSSIDTARGAWPAPRETCGAWRVCQRDSEGAVHRPFSGLRWSNRAQPDRFGDAACDAFARADVTLQMNPPHDARLTRLCGQALVIVAVLRKEASEDARIRTRDT